MNPRIDITLCEPASIGPEEVVKLSKTEKCES